MSSCVPNELLFNDLDFEWFLPDPKNAECVITIPNDYSFNINQKLLNKIPKNITIGISLDGKTLKIKDDTKGFKIPKSGSMKAFTFIAAIKGRGIKLPARYLVKQNDDQIIASFVPPITYPPLQKKTPLKPRTTGLKDMLTMGVISK